jgi:hypothetical protein
VKKNLASLTVISAVLAACLAVFLAGAPDLSAQEPYKLPPKEVVAIVDAPPTPRVSMSPSRDIMALIDYEPMPTIAYVSEPILRIAGMRITPATNSRQVLRFETGLSLKDMNTGQVRRIALPEGIEFASTSWAPGGQFMAFLRHLDDGVELWVVDVKAGTAAALTKADVNAVLGGYDWMPDGRRLVVSFVPEGRGPAPVEPRVPKGPNVQ